MQSYGNIGRAVLTRALGLQENYTEVVDHTITVLDEETSGCLTCKWHEIREFSEPDSDLYKSCTAACENCSTKCTKQEHVYKKIYHNEKNKFGYAQRLKSNAIKLFLLYHMQSVDAHGIIRNINLKDMAEIIGCNIKTIKNNNEILKEYGYIYFTETSLHTINVFLPEYETYYLPASVGGRGFIVLSREVFQVINSINTLNEIRITLRQFMEFDYKGMKDTSSIEKSYGELRRTLPTYCKRNVIQKAAAKLSMFITEIKDNIIRFTLRTEYNAKKTKEQTLAQYKQDLTDFCHSFNEDVVRANTEIFDTTRSKYRDFFKADCNRYRLLCFTDLELEDLSSLCLQYSYHIVIDALSSIYKTYILPAKKLLQLGAITRYIIQTNFENA